MSAMKYISAIVQDCLEQKTTKLQTKRNTCTPIYRYIFVSNIHLKNNFIYTCNKCLLNISLMNIQQFNHDRNKIYDLILWYLFLQVTDFGLSVVKSGVGIENLLMDVCGTPMYMGKSQYHSFRKCRRLLQNRKLTMNPRS